MPLAEGETISDAFFFAEILRRALIIQVQSILSVFLPLNTNRLLYYTQTTLVHSTRHPHTTKTGPSSSKGLTEETAMITKGT